MIEATLDKSEKNQGLYDFLKEIAATTGLRMKNWLSAPQKQAGDAITTSL